MAPIRVKKGQAQSAYRSVDEAIARLLATSEMLQYRARVRPDDAERVDDAIVLSRKPSPQDTTLRGENYWEFLRSIRRNCGEDMVGLCALGLGRSAIGSMKERLRLDLFVKIKQRRSEFNCEVLRHYLENKSTQGLNETQNHASTSTKLGRRSLTGDVYELTMDDARAIANSDQPGGKVWLTDPYDVNTASFITIPISDELKAQFIVQRPRLM